MSEYNVDVVEGSPPVKMVTLTAAGEAASDVAVFRGPADCSALFRQADVVSNNSKAMPLQAGKNRWCIIDWMIK